MSEQEQVLNPATVTNREEETPSAVQSEVQSSDSATAIAAANTDPKEEGESSSESKDAVATTLGEQDGENEGVESDDDYTQLSLPELLNELAKVVKEELNDRTRDRINLLQSLFNSQLEAFRVKAREEWKAVEDHGDDTYEPPYRAEEQTFRSLIQEYKERKRKHAEQVEAERKENLRLKREVIAKIDELTSRDEVKGDTYKEFEALRAEWNRIGLVPQADKEDLYQSYNHVLRHFYDYLSINRELRDLDYRRNLDAKIKLCEQAEDLLATPDVVDAFRKLQDLHSQWKDIGPEMPEKREEIWQRFASASAKINALHHKFFEDLKEQNEKILAAKVLLLEEVEKLVKEERSTIQAWRAATDKVKDLQKQWKELGFLPNRVVGSVRDRFQATCSQVFEGFRAYDRALRQEGKDNLQKLQDLCSQAEAMKESTDWSATTRAMIELQNKWRAVTFVPRKRRDELWEKFRAAMDYFFAHRDEAQAGRNKEEKDNLAAKEAIIHELENYTPNRDELQSGVEFLKELQTRWFNIGHVPFKQKDSILQRYRELLDKAYESLGVERRRIQVENFRSRVEEMAQGEGGDSQLQRERSRLRQQIQQMESECSLMENNLTFFRSSSSTNPLIQQQETKIKQLKEDIQVRKNKLKEIDKALRAPKQEKPEEKSEENPAEETEQA
ncbi:MAG: DUF349 domain-containing protein [Bacteroides sp.]